MRPSRTWNSARPFAQLLAVVAMLLLFPAVAHAHFTLDAPPQWIQQDALGDPQKVAPCGVDSTVTYTPTNAVTKYAPGQTIMMQWTETVAHDGWFRISLSYKNRTDLADPPYSANALGYSTDAGIENPPVAPVLVDDLFPHTAASITTPKVYTYSLKLPETPCTKCTLQVLQVMLNHPYNMPGGYFYHHCADIEIVAGAEGGTTATAGGSSSGSKGSSSGSGSTTGEGSSSGVESGSSGGESGSGGGITVIGGGSSSGDGAGSSSGGSEGTGSSTPIGSSNGGCAFSARSTSTAAGLGGLLGLAMGIVSRRRRRKP